MTGPASTGDGVSAVATGTVVDDRVRLSRSALYDVQRSFYLDQGLGAWASGTVPSYITCNPLIADSYAEVVLGFLRDARAAGLLPHGSRFPVVEVGSGSGRFGFLFLRRLRAALETSELADVRATLVMTDFDGGKFDAWLANPVLAPLVEAGDVDFAVMDITAPADPLLVVAGVPLSEISAGVPRVLMANYVLDSIAQDAFLVHTGDLHELLVSVEMPGDTALAPATLDRAAISWTAESVAGSAYYDDPDLDSLLDHYTSSLGDSALLVPTAAIDLVRWFASCSDGPALVIAADKGYVHEAELHSLPAPGLALHGGCFSLMVNFDAIRRVVDRRGGASFHPLDRPASLAVVAYAFGLQAPVALGGAYLRHVAERGPDDVFTLRTSLARMLGELTLPEIIVFARTHLADATVVLEAFPRLLDLAPEAPEAVRVDLHRLVNEVWDSYFPIGERSDLALCLGLLLSAIDRHREAIYFFEQSTRSHGRTATTVFSEAVARLALRELDVAMKLADEALELEPGFSAARLLKATVAAQLEVAVR